MTKYKNNEKNNPERHT